MKLDVNTMTTATREFRWDMAHMLADHKGLCCNLHGHTYVLQVTVGRMRESVVEVEGAADEGMVIDFSHLKSIVNTHIVNVLDHSTMVNSKSTDQFERQLWNLLIEYGKKHVTVDYRPTAENMVQHFFVTLSAALEREVPGVYLLSLRLYETPNSFAEITI